MTLRISVLIPTYRRPIDLKRCLDALKNQTRRPDEVVVARRSSDEESASIIGEFIEAGFDAVIDAVVGPHDNLVTSMNKGLRQTTGDLVALTDDDTEPPSEWIERLCDSFQDPFVGGVGGRDIQVTNPGQARVVGRLQWFGRIIGNHHLGIGARRDVDILKGANFCVRGDLLRAIGFDDRLRGNGNVSHWELSLSFEIIRRGFRLIYDPSLVVRHHVATRFDGDVNTRGGFNGPALRDAVHNETLAVLEHLSLVGRVAYLSWGHGIGTGDCPGLAQFPRTVARSGNVREAFQRLRYTLDGRYRGTMSYLFRRDAVKGTGSL